MSMQRVPMAGPGMAIDGGLEWKSAKTPRVGSSRFCAQFAGRWAGIYNPSQISPTIANHLATKIFAGWAGGIFHPVAPAASHGTPITTPVLIITPPGTPRPGVTLSPNHGVVGPRRICRCPGRGLRPASKIRTLIAADGRGPHSRYTCVCALAVLVSGLGALDAEHKAVAWLAASTPMQPTPSRFPGMPFPRF